VRLAVRYEPETGRVLHATETCLTLGDAPAPAAEKPKKKKKGDAALPGNLLNRYSSHPDERMQQLLYQSEDLRQIKNEWQRFWFNDQPSHMTPERIHGGIIGP
jgi:hypothetical protein